MEIRLGDSIRKLRKESGLTQEQLAEALGVSVSAVHKWESGKATPELEMLVDIAEFFETSVDAMLNYGWQKLNNAAEATYITSKTETDNDGYQYRCVVTDAHGAEATTASAVLHVVLDLPNTGDASMPALWLAMCLLSGFGLIVLISKKALL